ncbi:hypothetical protein lerEdw1_003437 [Lerista edwardsae]|nr:hypothetical protein lerEdw1_003437 [Lerista edwardsae]
MSLLYFCLTLTSLVAAEHIFHDARGGRQGTKGTKGTKGSQCICVIEFSEDSFPIDQIAILQQRHKEITIFIEKEMIEILKFEADVKQIQTDLLYVTETIRNMEINGIKDTTDFTKIKNFISKLLQVIKVISDKMKKTDTRIETLLTQVNNISSIVWQLEMYDTNQILAIIRENAILQKQLHDCEEAAVNSSFGVAPGGLEAPEYGKCNNKVLLSITKPFVVKNNWRGFDFKYGAWGKDFAVNNKNPDMYWVAPLNTDERLMENFRTYRNYSNLGLFKHEKHKSLSKNIALTWNYVDSGQGSGVIMYNGSLYYNCYNSRNLCKLDMATDTIKRKELDGAAYNNWYSYAGVNWQDFDFAGDEKGLWIVYATENRGGKITVGKVNPQSLKIEKSWETSLYKPNITNTFMICGVLYALRRVDAQNEQLFYSFNTNDGKEFPLDIKMEKIKETIQSMSYNPNDHKLYVYADGYLVTHDVVFKRFPTRGRRSVAYEAGQNAIIPFNGRRQQLTVIA